MVETLLGILVVSIILVLALLFCLLAMLIQKQQQPRNHQRTPLKLIHKQQHTSNQQQTQSKQNSPSTVTVSPKLESKLMARLQGDRALAERLLSQVRRKYPGKTETWYWEKVIGDLDSDRR
jgi:uncharacterized protein HemX